MGKNYNPTPKKSEKSAAKKSKQKSRPKNESKEVPPELVEHEKNLRRFVLFLVRTFFVCAVGYCFAMVVIGFPELLEPLGGPGPKIFFIIGIGNVVLWLCLEGVISMIRRSRQASEAAPKK